MASGLTIVAENPCSPAARGVDDTPTLSRLTAITTMRPAFSDSEGLRSAPYLWFSCPKYLSLQEAAEHSGICG